MSKIVMDFKKGDAVTHFFMIPASTWSAGGTLWFAAKTAPDDDTSDISAVINKPFDDSVVTDTTANGVAYKLYTLEFIDTDTDGVSFADGAKKKKYLGEFQFVPLTGSPISYPSEAGEFIEAVVGADIKRGTS